ncbi:hypothetical protein CEXT_80241 [Caerostris extrusa]|uniref:Uncharacterized protein n=1 Tax=Caerostris extrusa TaxID=172846 RepID=A0AAV4N9U8_CAEEX|nr:hypothetical protein CEXT_80241 [Caerostris extrusa]
MNIYSKTRHNVLDGTEMGVHVNERENKKQTRGRCHGDARHPLDHVLSKPLIAQRPLLRLCYSGQKTQCCKRNALKFIYSCLYMDDAFCFQLIQVDVWKIENSGLLNIAILENE